MSSKRVQVHPCHLPWRTPRDRCPFKSAQLQRSQHLERNIRNVSRLLLLEGLERADDIRQRLSLVIATDEITEQCFSRTVLRLGVDHLHNICERRILAHICFEQSFRIASIQPLAHETLRRRAQRLSAHNARAHDLHKVAQHLCVINYTRKDLFKQSSIANRQHCTKQGRHVFHVATLAGKHCSLGNELGLDLFTE